MDSNFSPFNVYEVYNPRDKKNSDYRLEGYNHDTKMWEMLSKKNNLLGYNSLEEIIDRIFEIRKNDMKWINIQSEYPQDPHSIHNRNGGMMVMGTTGTELVLKLNWHEMMELTVKVQKKIDKIKKYSK